MYAQRQNESPLNTRLPPSSGGQPDMGWNLAGRYGNAAMIEEMTRSGPPEGQMGALKFEEIGESDDERVWGGELMPRDDGADFLYGRVALDDYAAKVEAGIFRNDLLTLGRVDAQAGAWQDDDGNWNAGFEGNATGAHAGFHTGDGWDGDDPWIGCEGSLGTARAAARWGLRGDPELALSATGASLSVGGGTGLSEDRWWDSDIRVEGGIGAGLSTGSSWTDEDGDGVEEFNFALDGGALAEVGFEVRSELPGLAKQAWDSWWSDDGE